jgi:hypothetical protein
MACRLRTFALLVLLTLLQGIAPLLHAHVGGQFARTGTHVHFVQAGSSVSQVSGLREDVFHASEMPEIGLGHFIERRLALSASTDGSEIVSALSQSARFLKPADLPGPSSPVWLPPSLIAALHPPATAPPVLTV